MESLLEGVVFRLAILKVDFPADSLHISIAHLRPSPEDIKQARAKRHAPRVSVFDASRTTIAQARDIWNKSTPATAFEWDVPGVLAIGNEEWPRVFRVVRDELSPPASHLPGADGHCGIEGLHWPASMPKVLFKEFRATLARFSRPHGTAR